ncbi:phospholipid hydroperoxide glutathione peroxidase-like [Rhynchophorus ferrugineus]|uniref:phospholipid hydroperoxide glutathione peroxidase-like n=1 Tax=Rhynchophorus ferrugineus TaxID=354439 RepID=UPI003FCC7F99
MEQIEYTDYKNAANIYEFTVKDIKGEEVSLEKYKGHVCIIINVASNCSMAEDCYQELNELYEQYGETKGLKILAFPCDQFDFLEFKNNEKISEFIAERNVQFDLFDKVIVNGSDTHPLWKYLKYNSKISGNHIKWNFSKFIVNKGGEVVEFYTPVKNPKEMIPSLEKYF